MLLKSSKYFDKLCLMLIQLYQLYHRYFQQYFSTFLADRKPLKIIFFLKPEIYYLKFSFLTFSVVVVVVGLTNESKTRLHKSSETSNVPQIFCVIKSRNCVVDRTSGPVKT
jgi:hypothetical protein